MALHQKDWFGYLFAALAGALVPLAFSPFHIWPVMVISAGLLFFLLDKAGSAKAASLLGFCFGTGMFGTGVSWVYVSINQFGDAPAPLAALLTGLFVIALAAAFVMPPAWLFRYLKSSRKAWQKVLLFTGLWVLFEWVRSWFLTGFPWLLAGYTLLDTPFSGLAPVTGVYGLSLLIISSAAVLSAMIRDPDSHEREISFPSPQGDGKDISIVKCRELYGIATAVCLLAVTGVLLQGSDWTSPASTRPTDFSAVQGNISQDLKWEPGHLENTIRTFTGLSADQWDKDLLLWPENSIPAFPQNLPGLINALEEQAESTDTALILGAPWYDNGRYFNSLFGLGKAEGEYFKQKLVPFGEFVPLESMLRGIIAFFDLPMSSFSRGSAGQNGLQAKGQPLAAYICYEIVYPDFAAEQARGKDFLLTVSNDTWFGSSIGPEQHFQMVRMRSLETGRYQLRATNDGITALIDPKGNVVSALPRYQQGVLEGELPAMTGATPFMQFGSWPTLVLAFLLIAPCLQRKKL